MARVLIVDDDELMREMLLQSITIHLGHAAMASASLREGLALARSEPFDAVLLDVRLPDGNGIEAIPLFHEAPSRPEVIIITGEGDPDGAELAIKTGAWDYIEKPSSIVKITLPLTRALEHRAERDARRPPLVLRRDRIIGSSEQLGKAIESLAEASVNDMSVLITGPTGTGKEAFAHTLHENSLRAGKSFVIVDCAALPETLVESFLFGHRKGAFTGADRDQEGLVRQAHEGTLFLDEIGELPMAIQRSFLRVLQEHTYRPIGSNTEISSDFRLVSATNRNLEEMVRAGTFREDLYYRISPYVIELPPLRDRTGDVKELTRHFISRFCDAWSTGAKGYSPEFMEALLGHDWPGNVRELRNTIEKAVASARFETTLYPKHLPLEIRVRLARNNLSRLPSHSSEPEEGFPAPPLPATPPADQPLPRARSGADTAAWPLDWKSCKESLLSAGEKRYFEDLVKLTGGDVNRMADISGLTRARVYGIMKKHAIRARGRLFMP